MAVVVVRTSFTAAYLRSAAQFVHEAFVLETVAGDNRQEDLVDRHLGHVVGAVMLSVAALESELYELARHGPGHHLGSGGTDGEAKAYLRPLASMIDEQSPLERAAVLLHLLRKPPFETGKQPWKMHAWSSHCGMSWFITSQTGRTRSKSRSYSRHWRDSDCGLRRSPIMPTTSSRIAVLVRTALAGLWKRSVSSSAFCMSDSASSH